MQESPKKSKYNSSAHNAERSGLPWKEWKSKKKEEYKKWKENKMIKKQKKLEEKRLKESNSEHIKSKKVRDFTVSIAVPGSILDNAQTPELKTYLAGQIARAAVIFNVNEVIVFNDTAVQKLIEDDDECLKLRKKNGSIQMARILQYLECPQYLRKYYFPIHEDFQFAGLLNPLDIPHHLRADEECKYREGIVMNKPVKEGRGSFVYIGLKKPAIIDKVLEPHLRVTVQLDDEQLSKKHYKGKAVSPSAPYNYDNLYWGYNVRPAKSFSAVFSECPFKEKYDVIIGTSDKGDSVDSFHLPSFKHLLIVFGGLKGLEACFEDETLEAHEPRELFNYYLNTCPRQGSRVIRTEEAIFVTLAALRPQISGIEALHKNKVA